MAFPTPPHKLREPPHRCVQWRRCIGDNCNLCGRLVLAKGSYSTRSGIPLQTSLEEREVGGINMGDHFDTMQVCKRWGHKITEYYDTYPTEHEDYCKKCGSATTHVCGNCNANIRGYHHFDMVVGGGGQEVPLNCHKCGSAYPWKRRLLAKRTATSLVAPFKYVVDSLVSIFKK